MIARDKLWILGTISLSYLLEITELMIKILLEIPLRVGTIASGVVQPGLYILLREVLVQEGAWRGTSTLAIFACVLPVVVIEVLK